MTIFTAILAAVFAAFVWTSTVYTAYLRGQTKVLEEWNAHLKVMDDLVRDLNDEVRRLQEEEHLSGKEE